MLAKQLRKLRQTGAHSSIRSRLSAGASRPVRLARVATALLLLLLRLSVALLRRVSLLLLLTVLGRVSLLLLLARVMLLLLPLVWRVRSPVSSDRSRLRRIDRRHDWDSFEAQLVQHKNGLQQQDRSAASHGFMTS